MAILPARASWYVDNSRAAAHLGGPAQYGPFRTYEDAKAFCDANNVGMTVIPGGSNDDGGSGSDKPYQGPNFWQMLRDRKEKKIEQKRLQLVQEAWNANHDGVEFAKKEDWPNAIAKYEESLRKNPDDDTVKRNLAQAKASFANYRGTNAYHKEDWAAAVAFFKEALAVNPYPENAAVYQDNLNRAENSLEDELRRKADKEAAAGMQKAIQSFTQTLQSPTKAQPLAPGGLDFDGRTSDTAPGGLDFISVTPAVPSTTPAPSDLRDAPSDPPAPSRVFGPPSAVDRAVAGVFANAPEGVAERVRKGFQAVATRDWKVAIAWFEDALNRDPDNASLQALLQAARSNEQQQVDSVRAVALDHYRQAFEAQASGNTATAIMEFDAGIKADPHPPSWIATMLAYERNKPKPNLVIPTDEDMDLVFGPLPPRHYTLDASGQMKEVPPNTNQEGGLFIKGSDGKFIQVPQPKDVQPLDTPPPASPPPYWKQWLDALEQPVKPKASPAAVISVRG